MIIKSVYSGLRVLAFCVLIGIAAVWLLENFLFKQTNCYDFKQSATILQSLKQAPIWRGLVVEDKQEKMVAVFGNSRTGAWTRVKVDADGNVCFVETGTDFQNVVKNSINL